VLQVDRSSVRSSPRPPRANSPPTFTIGDENSADDPEPVSPPPKSPIRGLTRQGIGNRSYGNQLEHIQEDAGEHLREESDSSYRDSASTVRDSQQESEETDVNDDTGSCSQGMLRENLSSIKSYQSRDSKKSNSDKSYSSLKRKNEKNGSVKHSGNLLEEPKVHFTFESECNVNEFPSTGCHLEARHLTELRSADCNDEVVMRKHGKLELPCLPSLNTERLKLNRPNLVSKSNKHTEKSTVKLTAMHPLIEDETTARSNGVSEDSVVGKLVSEVGAVGKILAKSCEKDGKACTKLCPDRKLLPDVCNDTKLASEVCDSDKLDLKACDDVNTQESVCDDAPPPYQDCVRENLALEVCVKDGTFDMSDSHDTVLSVT